MILIDAALSRHAAAGKHIRVGVIGAGFMVAGVVLQIRLAHPAMRVVAIAARRPDQAEAVFRGAGAADAVKRVETQADLNAAIAAGLPAVCEDPALVAKADGVDVVLEATGSMDFALRAVLPAIEAGKPVVLMNAELDATIGPYLKVLADKAGVILTNVDGDQPGVEMNLIRYVRGLGFKPLLSASVKTLQDQHRNPTTQAAFAARWRQNAEMVTSFADGSKVAFEQAVVANATGMRVAKRGMLGIDPTNKDPTLPLRPLEDYVPWLTPHLDPDKPGLVEFVVGARPSAGVFVIGHTEDPDQRHYLGYYKLGEGPYYLFYTPYHLVHLEAPLTIARVALFADAAVSPEGPPKVGVVATAKRDLPAGAIVDGIGGYDTYGQAENMADICANGDLPMAMAQGCTLLRPISKDAPIRFADVAVPPGRAIDALYAQQLAHFGLNSKTS
jgi:predicted homoserine dehydrogenase-like protein